MVHTAITRGHSHLQHDYSVESERAPSLDELCYHIAPGTRQSFVIKGESAVPPFPNHKRAASGAAGLVSLRSCSDTVATWWHEPSILSKSATTICRTRDHPWCRKEWNQSDLECTRGYRRRTYSLQTILNRFVGFATLILLILFFK